MDNKDKGIKKYITRENMPIIVAIILLIIMVIALLIVIFHKDNRGLILPDAPKEKNLSVEIYDYQNAKNDPNDLTKGVAKDVKVQYHFVSDYYKKGIMLSNTKVNYTDNEFIISSGPYSDTPFISAVDIKGNLKWIYKIKFSDYNTLKIKKIEKVDGNYYVFAVGTTKNLNDNMVIKINSKGKEEKREIVSKGVKNSLSTATKTDNGFAITTDGEDGIIIYTLTKELKQEHNAYNLANDENNIFNVYNPSIMSMTYKDKVLSMVVQYRGLKDEKMYLVNYNMDSNSATITPFNELMKLANPYTNPIYNFESNFLVGRDKGIYMYNGKGEIVKNYDYSNLKLKEDSFTNEDGEKIDNSIEIEGINVYGDNILVKSVTNSNYVYDVFDKELNLKTRYTLNLEEYETTENVLLDVFYIDGKLYEVHSYGIETPSIMISVIG